MGVQGRRRETIIFSVSNTVIDEWQLISTGAMPGKAEYRFTTENGIQKMLNGEEGESFYMWTKIGDKLTDLPELGPLGYEGATGGKFWAQNGVVVK